MIEYFVDFAIIAALIIGITALNGVITHNIGYRLFGGGKRDLHVEQTKKTQAGWKLVGGRK
ncbi:hypothetical protein [Calidifontibacillus erzurumensis]|uniref:Uncharacterized protein n=1 Tax=Calidifontibacillus erzurumensis TaxID=2741433 RepID=A0A8J8GE28_9BACI|nr:hypothetical protein [Calidifontibacillus erzurumensis]NSL51461.1 hypothetical protein [Calidifontibacillus erzurumensis]